MNFGPDLALATAHDLELRVQEDGRRICRSDQRELRRFSDPLPFETLGAFRPSRTIREAYATLPPGLDRGEEDFRRLVAGCYEEGLLHETGGVLDRPLVIISTPRAGSTLLFELLTRSPALWSIGGESHPVLESVPALCPENRGYESHCLTAADARPEIVARLRDGFVTYLRDSGGHRFLDLELDDRPGRVRLLEKTPRNVLRVPFVAALFPDARFVYLHRDARQCVSSILEAWRAPGFWQWKGDLPGWDREEWCMLLPPGWRSLVGRPLEEIATFQWGASNRIAMDDLQALPRDSFLALDYADLIADPAGTLKRVCGFADLPFDDELLVATSGHLRPSSSVVSPPDPEKWRKNEAEVLRVLPSLEDVIDRLSELPG